MTRSINIHINGVVQGVGFRPYIYRLARRHRLSGWVLNSSAGVEIAAEGEAEAVLAFVDAIPRELPPQAAIDSLSVTDTAPAGRNGFAIRESSDQPGVTLISPDIAVCGDCLREMADPGDRRQNYPFINCTNCGPRFSIIAGTPYDRPLTSMRPFALCPACRCEYDDPADRRFHAQPVACPDCGPQAALRDGSGAVLAAGGEALARCARALRAGSIVAIKGIGGYHLACDASDAAAIATLRQRKGRPDKPLAVMCPDLDTTRRLCEVSGAEAALLASPQAPIVLLRSRSVLPDLVAPQNRYLGVMLPYAPLHHLLFQELRALGGGCPALVMTSANPQDLPVIADDGEALAALGGVADAFLTHDRGIVNRCDDSIAIVGAAEEGSPPPVQIVRHARGYAPNPIPLPAAVPPALATGGEMKNCFALAQGRRAFVSQHIGELTSLETLAFFEEMAGKYRRWFGIDPQVIVHDRHPDYLGTRWALRQGIPARAVQHHRAHVLSVLADHGWTGPVIGVAFDGTGHGDDGAVWGGEFFVSDGGAGPGNCGLARAGHLEYLPLPGGEAAIKRPYRIAAAYCQRLLGAVPGDLFAPALHPELEVVAAQVGSGANVAMTSSMGRLFDAVSALLGVRDTISYEAQAAIALEQACDPAERGRYGYDIAGGVVSLAPMWAQLAADRRSGVAPAVGAARFHNTVIDFAAVMCDNIKLRTGIGTVALSGGVFQNRLLLERLTARLAAGGFRVLVNRQVPANDGGIALGQLMALTATT